MDSSIPNPPEIQELPAEAEGKQEQEQQQLKAPPSPAPRRHLVPTTIAPPTSTTNNNSSEEADSISKPQDTTDSLLQSEAIIQGKESVSESDKIAVAGGEMEKNQDSAMDDKKEADVKATDPLPPPIAPKARKRPPRSRASSTLVSDPPEVFEKLKHTSGMHRRSTGTLLVPDSGKNSMFVHVLIID